MALQVFRNSNSIFKKGMLILLGLLMVFSFTACDMDDHDDDDDDGQRQEQDDD